MEEEARKRAAVQIALGTLSYSEMDAVQHIFEQLEGEEGLLVASKIADRVGITRSVIVNALRKFESAGVNWMDYDVTVVKQGYIFPYLKENAAGYVMSLTDGATPQDTASIPFKRIMRPMFPVDQI